MIDQDVMRAFESYFAQGSFDTKSQEPIGNPVDSLFLIFPSAQKRNIPNVMSNNNNESKVADEKSDALARWSNIVRFFNKK